MKKIAGQDMEHYFGAGKPIGSWFNEAATA